MSDVLNKAAFRVFRGKESSVFNQEHQDGYVYFATDTGKIYMDTATEEKVLMGGGGNSGIYYAKKKFTDPADLTFSISDITTNELPDINDLVINVSADIGGDIERDGFYQVVEVIELENKVITNYLPVGGGGGGGTGSGGTTGFASIDYIVPKDGVASTLISEPYWIEYKLTAQDSAGDTVPNTGTATWIINGKTINGGQVSPGNNKFNVTPYLDAKLDVNSIKLSISINTGSSINTIVSKIWQITAIDLQLEWNHTYSPDSYINSSTFSVSFTPWGNVACKAYLLFDTNEDYRYTMDIPASRTGKLNSFPTMNSLPYGTHKAQMWLTASINGKDYRTPTITHEFTFTYGGTSTIITSPFNQVEATQYDTIRIPFLIYNPETALNKMRILVNDEEVSPYTEYDQKLQNFDYTIGRSGIIKIVLEHDANIKKEFELSVTPLELDVEEPQTPSYKLKASDIVDNTALKAIPGLTFSSNFDWQNGGMKSETSTDGVITKYICIKNGTTMTIDYELFNNNATQYGKNFKFIFKAANCYKYDAQVLQCFDTTSNIGININAQRAIFNSGANILKSDYCENSYIELEMEVWPKSNIDQYMMLWVDGVPSNVQVYESSTFEQHNPQVITIGSNDCDVYVYLVKIYERYLNEIEHLDNFIMDAPNTQEKVQRYKRNDILDNSGDISYKKLVKNNPGCHAYLYDIPQMTKDKNTKIDCYYSEYCNDPDKPIITADKAKMFVQGTSSAAYGVAAFNLRTDFRKTTMYDGDGNVIEGKEVSETAIPINYTCTKVNVASCENANNVYNQEWYNKFQPYHDAHRRKNREDGKLYRDCMEFDFGVVFVKDNNPNDSYKDSDGEPSEIAYLDANVFADTAGYVDEPYYKQYSIGNMGNDKKNVEIFHDTENPLACCVEVANNQTDKQFMIENITLNDVAADNTENFEFRYPDGNGEASAEMKAGWVRFVNWMADSNPVAATNTSIIDLPVEQRTFEPYTFKGFNPPGYEGEENPTGISLKGVTVSAYATDKQLDADGKWMYDEEGKIIKSDTPVPYTHDTYEYRMAKMLHLLN